MQADIILRLDNISKQFPGVQALDHVGLEIKKGEVHALCGENGAGKSTLMNILAGIYKPDEGKIILNGNEVKIEDQKHAQKLGISIVYQDRSLVHSLSVAENIFADRHFKTKFGLISKKTTNQKARELCEQLGLDVQPDTPVEKLSPAKQQMIEIAKALSLNAQILILDEPTATITEVETHTLFDTIKKLRERGISVIYISHRLAEIFSIADRVSALKDGKYMGTKDIGDIDIDGVIKMMVGRDLEKVEYVSAAKDHVVFEVRNFSSDRFQNIHFYLKQGEILSISGLAGAGRTEVARAIIGADPRYSGEVYIDGELKAIDTVVDSISNGIGYMPEDRKEQGLFLEMAVADNIVSGNLKAVSRRGFINDKKINEIAGVYKHKLSIATPSVRRRVINLSGGNQQKVVLSKWLMVNPKILIVDEPTRGVDVGAKAEIYAIMRRLVKEGTSIIVISSDLPEVLTISDRILVMWNGQITGEVSRNEFNEEDIMHHASGTKMNYGVNM